MTDEIKALREEIVKLRERIAVLEARPVLPSHLLQVGPGHLVSPYRVGDPPYVLPTITCVAGIAGTLGPLASADRSQE